MGGEESEDASNATLNDTEMQKYERLHPNLSEHEINEIYKIFKSLNPDSDGFVKAKSINAVYSNTAESDT